MLILIPIGLLLAAALAITIQNYSRPKFGTSWLIAVSACIVTWLMTLIMRLRLPTSMDIYSWSPSEIGLMGHFSLLMDYDSWPYTLALISITLAVILSDASRTRYDSTPRSWSASLVITAMGLLALHAGSSLMLMAAWILVDLLEFLYLLKLKDADRFILRIVFSLGVRMVSILMIYLATIRGWQAVGDFSLSEIPQDTAFFFFIAAGLRLGVFPLNMPFLQEPALRRGAGNIIRLAPAASSLSLLARLPADVLPSQLSGWMPLFQAMLAIAALYASFRWLLATDEIEGRPFWIVAWGSLATASALNGEADASLAWGLVMILAGSLLFLYYPRVQRMNFLLYFGLIGVVGLPYTPAVSGWSGLVANGVTFWTVLFIIAHAVMVFGYLNRVLQPGGAAGALESWARIVYPLGLIIIIQSILIMGLIGWPGSLTLGVWWPGATSSLLVIGSYILIRRLGITPPYIQLPASSGLSIVLNWILPRLEPIFRLEWVYKAIWWVNNLFGKVLQSLSTILEGDGGILWMILLLVLLISILSGGGSS